ncbi:exosortase/archaeosortase family protein [Candidatus Bathyarchaeota archaeon]|nr:exosortase/archaeosortase family protein [Candidatus Bathyarchaeota archaeon]
MKAPRLPRIIQLHNTLALTVKISAILLATIAIFYQDLAMLANEALRSELMSYTLLVPFLIVYIIYRKRKMLSAVTSSETATSLRKPTHTCEIVGALLCFISLLLYWHGSFTFHSFEFHMASLPLFIAGSVILIFNVQTVKALTFPIMLLLFLVPQTEILGPVGTALSTHSAEVVYSILKALGLRVTLTTVYLTPALIIQGSGGTASTFVINTACSGIHSVSGFAICSVLAAYIVKGVIWKKALLLLMGFPLIYVLNVLRIIILVFIEYQFEIDTASQVFHVFGGWVLVFSGTILLLYLSKRILKIRLITKAELCPECSQSSKQTYDFCPACGKILKNMQHKISRRDLSKIATFLLFATLIAYFQLPVFTGGTNPPKVDFQSLKGQEFGAQILPKMQGYTLRFVYRDSEFEEVAQQDAALVYAYLPENESEEMVLTTLEFAKSQSSLHGWEVCLVTWPQTHGYPSAVEQLDLREIQLLQNPPVVAELFTFRYFGEDTVQVILYWREYIFIETAGAFEREFVKISLVAYATDTENFSKTQNLLTPFGQAIANHLLQTKTWSQIIIIVAEHGKTLIALAATLLIAVFAVEAINNRTEKRESLLAYKKLSSERQTIIQAVHEEKEASLNAIASAYQKLSGKIIQPERLLEKLRKAEQIGLLDRKIISRNEEPVVVWGSNMGRTIFLE